MIVTCCDKLLDDNKIELLCYLQCCDKLLYDNNATIIALPITLINPLD